MKFLTAYCTDIGIKKNTNQDALLIKMANSGFGDICFLVICDGMGGLSKGEVASSYVIRRLSVWFEEELPYILEEDKSGNLICKSLGELVGESNERLAAYGRQGNFHLGTTMTGMLVIGETYYVVHVGDTRLYEIGDTIRQLTQDHTVIANEIRMGRMTKEQAKLDARRNVLTQCIGASPKVEPEFLTGRVEKNATYMVCCDGFRHQVEEREIYAGFRPEQMIDEDRMKRQCEYFVKLNKQREEKDNISVIIMRAY